MTESLAGRFEIIPATHWAYAEMRDAFGWDLEQYIYYGGYPGAADLIADEERWRRYIVRAGRRVMAVEVKSGYAQQFLPGMEALSKEFRI